MKFTLKIVAVMLVTVSLLHNPAMAAPPQDEIDELLTSMGWTNEDLNDYLSYFELSVDDFETIDELQSMLGTPITSTNLNELLSHYGMSNEELNTLLAEFGESVEDYWFIEDLDTSIQFYTTHDEELKGVEDFLGAIGLMENEVEALFNHLMAIDQTTLEMKMEEVAAKLEPFLMMDPEAELSEAEVNELLTVYEDIMESVQLDPKFYYVDAAGNRTAVTYSQVANMETLKGQSLLIELYDRQGALLVDMQLSEEMLNSSFAINAGDKLVDVGDMAGELTELKHDKLPNTASSYPLWMMLGLMLILTGLFLRKIKVSIE